MLNRGAFDLPWREVLAALPNNQEYGARDDKVRGLAGYTLGQGYGHCSWPILLTRRKQGACDARMGAFAVSDELGVAGNGGKKYERWAS